MTMPLTTAAAAEELGLSLRTVQAHITAGNLHAKWSDLHRRYLIEPEELERFKREKRKPGWPKRPKKARAE